MKPSSYISHVRIYEENVMSAAALVSKSAARQEFLLTGKKRELTKIGKTSPMQMLSCQIANDITTNSPDVILDRKNSPCGKALTRALQL